MAQILSCSINLSKIDKSKIVEGKNDAKYYNFDVIVNDEVDQFGNSVAITQKQTKEERDAKQKKEYIGNGRIVWSSQPSPNTGAKTAHQHAPVSQEGSSDLPF